jgi:hypothetical protein
MSLVDNRQTVSTPAFIAADDIYAILEAALKIVVQAWVTIRRKRMLTDEHRTSEPRTAGCLYWRMREVERTRHPRRPPMKIKAEVGTFSAEVREVPDGRIDIEIIYSLSDEPDLRVECKRVSATVSDRRTDLATEYVDEGVLRFVGDKYGHGHVWGVMIAFVIDGEFADAASIIAKYVAEYHNDAPPHLSRAWRVETRFGRHRHLFNTQHLQGGGPQHIDLLHLFLPFPRRKGHDTNT